MRWAGETSFCSPAHKATYNQEHSELGLQRLLEEVGTSQKFDEDPVSPAEATGEAEIPPAGSSPVTPEPETLAVPELAAQPEPDSKPDPGALPIWTYPPSRYRVEPNYRTSLRLDFELLPYEAKPAGNPAASPAPEPDPSASAEPVASPAPDIGEQPTVVDEDPEAKESPETNPTANFEFRSLSGALSEPKQRRWKRLLKFTSLVVVAFAPGLMRSLL